MKYSIRKFLPGNSRVAEKLEQLDCGTSDELLLKYATPASREELAHSVSCDVELIDRTAAAADLVRVKGVGVTYAMQLVNEGGLKSIHGFLRSEVDSVLFPASGRVASSPDILAKANEIHEKLINSGVPKSRAIPVAKLCELADEAAELRPRVVARTPDRRISLRRDVWELLFANDRSANKGWWKVVGIFSAILLVPAAIWLLANKGGLIESCGSGGIYLPYVEDSVNALSMASIGFLFTAVVCIVLAGIGVFLFWRGYLIAVRKFFLHIVFRSAEDYRYLKEINRVNVSHYMKFFNVGRGILFLTAIGAIVYFLNRHSVSDWALKGFGYPLAIVLSLIIAAPALQTYLAKRKVLKGNVQFGRKYFIYMISHWVGVFGVMFILLGPPLSGALKLAETIFTKGIYGRCIEKVESAEDSVTRLPDRDGLFTRDQAVHSIRLLKRRIERTPGFFRLSEAEMNSIMGVSRGILAPMVALAAVFLVFFPFVTLSGVKRALFYIFLTLAGVNLNSVLKEIVVKAYQVPPGSWEAGTFVVFSILIAAMVLDTAFDMLGEQGGICNNCGNVGDSNANFCHKCGLAR